MSTSSRRPALWIGPVTALVVALGAYLFVAFSEDPVELPPAATASEDLSAPARVAPPPVVRAQVPAELPKPPLQVVSAPVRPEPASGAMDPQTGMDPNDPATNPGVRQRIQVEPGSPRTRIPRGGRFGLSPTE